jgi:DNA-binding transcriptional regulator YiaG
MERKNQQVLVKVPPPVRVLPPSCEQIVLIISALCVTTKDFAELVGVPESTVSAWKKGEVMPDSINSLKLWELYEYPEVQRKVHLLSHIGTLVPVKERYK